MWLLSDPSPSSDSLSTFPSDRVLSLLTHPSSSSSSSSSQSPSSDAVKAWSPDETLALFNHLAGNDQTVIEYSSKVLFSDTAALFSETLSRSYTAIEYVGDASADYIVVAYPDVVNSLLQCIRNSISIIISTIFDCERC